MSPRPSPIIFLFNPASIFCLAVVLVAVVIERVAIALHVEGVNTLLHLAEIYLIGACVLFWAMPKRIALVEVEYRNKYRWHYLKTMREGNYVAIKARMPLLWCVVPESEAVEQQRNRG